MGIEKPRFFFDRAGPLARPVEGARSAYQRRAGPGSRRALAATYLSRLSRGPRRSKESATGEKKNGHLVVKPVFYLYHTLGW